MSGASFRCVVSNDVGKVISAEAELTVYSATPASIDKQPESAIVEVGRTASFTITTKGEPIPVFQWIIYRANAIRDKRMPKNVGELLEDNATYSGTHSNTLTVRSARLLMDGDEFVCTLSNGYLSSGQPVLNPPVPPIYTNKVSLQVFKPRSLIVSEPASVVTQPGSIVNFIVTVPVDTLPNFQWQCLPPRETVWQPLKNGLLYTGVNDGNLIVHEATLALSGTQYRCVLDDGFGGEPQYSKVVELTVKK